jgi:hypothetical protein
LNEKSTVTKERLYSQERKRESIENHKRIGQREKQKKLQAHPRLPQNGRGRPHYKVS